jgi:hypothetical protein
MKKSVRLSLLAVLVLAAMAFSAYGVALAAPGLHLNDLFHSLAADQVTATGTAVSTETPEVEETEVPDVEETEAPEVETPEATETPDVEDDDSQGEEDNDGDEVICAASSTDTTSTNSIDCSGDSSDDSGGGSGGGDDGGDD